MDERRTGRTFRLLFAAFSLLCLIAALAAPDRADMLPGFGRIVTQPAQLTRDTFRPDLGGLSGTMLNFALVTAFMTALTLLPGAVINGGTVAAFFLTAGFCSYGLNLLNMLPFLPGTLLYALLRRQKFGQNLNAALFSTALAPLVSELMWRYPDAEAHGLTASGAALALAVGILTGLTMPVLLGQARSFHRGYNLYNAGPAAGFLCMLFYALMYRAIGRQDAAPAITALLGDGHPAFVHAFCLTFFLGGAAAGLLLQGGSLRGYGGLIRHSGWSADFTRAYPAGLVIWHIGIYGLFILAYYDLIGATFTGPTMGAVFCMVCWAAGGATPLNVLPVMLGYLLASLAGATPLNAQGMVVGLCFASGLAPVSGEFGIAAGALAGAMHYALVTSVPFIHGGFNLYNGGFTAGIVCFLLVPVLEHWFTPRREKTSR